MLGKLYLLFAICLGMKVTVWGFLSPFAAKRYSIKSWPRRCHFARVTDTEHLPIQRTIFRVPYQEHIDRYESLVKDHIGEDLLIRWYISHFEDHHAIIEAVHENPACTRRRDHLLS